MFKVGDTVKRIGKGLYDGLAKPDDLGEGYGLIGIVDRICEQEEWPPKSGRILPKLYFVKFDSFTFQIGIIEEHLILVHLADVLRVNDRVIVQTYGCVLKDGYITKLWAGSHEEKTSGRYGLDKYFVQFYDGNNGWFYGCDISKK